MFETLLTPEIQQGRKEKTVLDPCSRYPYWKQIVEKSVGKPGLLFAEKHIRIDDRSTYVNIPSLVPFSYYPYRFSAIADFIRINDHRRLNKYFKTVNARLHEGGILIGCAVSGNIKRKTILSRYPGQVGIILYFLHFVFRRIIPKIPVLKKIYFTLTMGRGRMFSETEILGRLVSCGFKILEESIIDNLFYFAVQKVSEPMYDIQPTYGPLIKLKRVGKNGRIIKVYKFRTMHPYAEYLQEYIYKKNKISMNGKFNDDFRIARLGQFMRKLWIDEFPMIINLLKGELKIIGVRPLSEQYFNLYPEWLQKKRIATKPGLIPPYYADLPKSFDEIIDSENLYLERWKKSPFLTDFRYFMVAFYNILIKKARSS
ncbi:MAG: sugar transferase [Bacteroidota bacterium]